MFFISTFFILNAATAELVLNTLNGKFSAEFLSADGDGAITGYATLGISASSDFSFSTNTKSSEWEYIQPLYQRADGVTIISEQDILYLPIQRVIRVINGEAFPEIEPTLCIGASPQSAFARSVDGFVIEPLSDNTGRIHINPNSVTDLTYGGEMFYSPAVIDTTWGSIWGTSDAWGVNTAIKIVDPRGNSAQEQSQLVFRPCSLSTTYGKSRQYTIPTSVYQIVVDTITARGVEIVRRQHSTGIARYLRGDITQELISSLPTLQYIVQSTNGMDASIGIVPPSDYVVPTNDPRVYELLVSRILTTEICVLSGSILGKLVIHFDTQNNLVGFGEPLIEL